MSCILKGDNEKTFDSFIHTSDFMNCDHLNNLPNFEEFSTFTDF